MENFRPETINVNDAPRGQGDYMRVLARGEHLAMRIWIEETPADKESVMHSHGYETVGYVIEGRARLHFEGDSVLLEPGDSWLVPAHTPHFYLILEMFTAIEATSPPSEAHLS
ncbi:cupin domain-containing protein [Bradymonadaceae bacterium TMQ3]|uniref:Cupin domain-containing protein n=1 Tax=Lujinxingia sediminis TaxID=2480984 RepID=A0ABY0CSP0_9DELT|nr:cupin domain-containing protein [Lujinxingia sediminis]RDV38738.1 cupin domain-containing protein [Bradymonadaceae bacterium TMQ3]RVU43975.1 cupin domain-containing protein [Lujinxingia sediminis]TXC76489.1 cupin domain-containing protein [Bradymonadales bacterium TMQ1]